jgi:type I restriction enzyme S subunit
MNLAAKRISQLGRVVTGKTPPTSRQEFFGGEYPFVTPSDLEYDHYTCRKTERTVTEEAKYLLPNQFVPADAVMFTCIGATIGKCAIAPGECLTNQQINSVIANEHTDPKFLYYLLCHNVDIVKGLGGGAATPIVSKSKFEEVELLVPSFRDQQAISAILSAYDDLIENNCRRMTLLEEAARQLYREWFVRLRFPGHEHTRIINGVPEGWQNRRIKEIADVNRETLRGSFDGEIEYIDISSVSPGNINETTPYSFREAPSRARRVVQHGDIIWSCVRPNRKSYAVIWQPVPNLIASTGFAVISPRTVPTSFLIRATTTDSFVGYLENHARGAAYPAVVAGDFERAEVLVPRASLGRAFDEQAEPLLAQAHTLRLQNQKLRAARDLLLPRLMSGGIAV